MTMSSSKLNVKQTKKDRPKSSDRFRKKRDGTPDKSATPSQEAQDENCPPSRQIIWDEEIEKLQIKPEELEKVILPHPPSEPKPPVSTAVVTVRKRKPESELKKPKLKSVLVAKPATSDAPLKPVDYSGYAGPRYDEAGRVIHYSILGTFEDYRQEAILRGDLLDIPTPRIKDDFFEKPTLKYEKHKGAQEEYLRSKMEENNALKNWQLKMIERKRQQGYISKLLQKAPQDLAMNQAETYRQTQEERYLMDRTIPFVDYGKGYRIGSEFWKQQEQFGDELSGLHMTLTQTERGFPPPVEHVGIPNVVRKEKGISWDPTYRNSVHHPWHRSSYLQTRHKQLQSIMNELDPHKPDFSGLQVIGSNNPYSRDNLESNGLSDTDFSEHNFDGQPTEEQQAMEQDPFHEYPDVHPLPFFGPSIKFAGQSACWTGDSNSLSGQVGIEARLTFEAYTNNRITTYLEVVNDGTTAVYYDWKKLPKDNPFDLVQLREQRFYFNNSSGVILPSEILRIPFVFKSERSGVYTEQWLMETRPVLCRGAELVLTLRGVALQEDTYQKQREELEKELEAKESQLVVSQFLQELISGIRTPERARSPVDAYITEEEIFHRNNPGMFYRHGTVQELKLVYAELFPEGERESAIWDLSVMDLKDAILNLDDDERKEKLLAQMNTLVPKLTFIPPLPVEQKLYNVCHNLLAEAIDGIVNQSVLIRSTMGLPLHEIGEILEEIEEPESIQANAKRPRAGTLDGDNKKGARPSEKAKTEATKDKKLPAAKDAKAGKAAKESKKEETKGKTPTPVAIKKSSPAVKLTAAPPSGSVSATDQRATTPTISAHSPAPMEHEQALEKKYREKLDIQAFLILGEKMEDMDRVFQDILKANSKDKGFRIKSS